jgi:hypothetical protein
MPAIVASPAGSRGKAVRFESPLPDDMAQVRSLLDAL